MNKKEIIEKLKNIKEEWKDINPYLELVSKDFANELSRYTVKNDEFDAYSLALIADSVISSYQKDSTPASIVYHLNLLRNARCLPQVIDTIADEDLADNFRGYFGELLKIDLPPKRIVKEKSFEDYPENVKVAVEWWVSNISKFEKDASFAEIFASMFPDLPSINESLKEDELNNFMMNLASNISKELNMYHRCVIDVNYNPCEILKRAENSIGRDNILFNYPGETKMEITDDKVSVKKGYKSSSHDLWRKKDKDKIKIKTTLKN